MLQHSALVYIRPNIINPFELSIRTDSLIFLRLLDTLESNKKNFISAAATDPSEIIVFSCTADSTLCIKC